jgi:voltage-gated potassium channel Kch
MRGRAGERSRFDMPQPTFRERLRYGFDNYMARGTGALVLALFVITAIIVVVVSLAVFVLDAEHEGGALEIFWRSMLATFDPAVVGGEHGSALFLLSLLAVTFAGIFITSILISILTAGIEGRLADLRRGRSRVIESGHTVVLGWSPQIFAVLSELIASNVGQRRGSIVILAEQDKVEMEEQIRDRVPPQRHTRIVCRSGSSIDIGELRLASIETSKSIVVLSPQAKSADAGVIKTILAITNNPRRRPEPYHIVAEIREPANLEVAQLVGRDEAQLIVVSDLIAQIIAQTCRQSGLSAVYTGLLNFEGDEIYLADAPADLIGRTFGDALLAFDTSSIIGLQAADGPTRLNPPMDQLIQANDRLIAISAHHAAVQRAEGHVGEIRTDLIVEPRELARPPERTLVLDWNRRGRSIIRTLDGYVPAGSRIVVVADQPGIEASVGAIRSRLVNQDLDVRQGDTTDRSQLTAICEEGFDHVIVLCADDLEPGVADARTLITLLHLREIERQQAAGFSITSEMLDVRNRELASVTRADDFIVSDQLASLLISQLSGNRNLKAIFDDLFTPEGSEIYLRPATEYVVTGQSMTFATVVESARRRGEVAIGYRQLVHAEDADRAYGVVINPVKSAALVLADDDRVIVLGEKG